MKCAVLLAEDWGWGVGGGVEGFLALLTKFILYYMLDRFMIRGEEQIMEPTPLLHVNLPLHDPCMHHNHNFNDNKLYLYCHSDN